MTCAKRVVFCELYNTDGDLVSVGSNSCAKPQKKCPRLPGEGYAKCDTICNQFGHAEEVALDIASSNRYECEQLDRAVIYGHHRVCAACKAQLEQAGITRVEFRP